MRVVRNPSEVTESLNVSKGEEEREGQVGKGGHFSGLGRRLDRDRDCDLL